MKQLPAAFFTVALATASLSAQETTWKLDNVHSNVVFTVQHLVISEVMGTFREFDVKFRASKPDFSDASIEADVKTASVDTDNEKRDNHLRSDDFFNAQQFPGMKFRSTSMKRIGEKQYALTGDLTIRDVTKPVTFTVDFLGVIDGGQFGTRSGWKAITTINRFDYKLNWDRSLEAGGLIVGKDITIQLNLEFSKN